MKKISFAITLLLIISSAVWSQFDMDKVMTEKVNKLKKTLPSLKGKARIDCLNDIAEAYYWIWDDYAMELKDSMCVYANTSYKEANKLKYKKGIGYANLVMQECAAAYVKKEDRSTHQKVEKFSAEAIRIGEELNDYTLIGRSYFNLNRMERWNGDLEKAKVYAKKTVDALEKAKTIRNDVSYHPITYADCPDCRGSELQLATMYFDLAVSSPPKDKKELFEKARFYFEQTGDLSGVGRSYQGLAANANLTTNLSLAVENINKAIEFFKKDKNPVRELESYITLCGTLWNLGEFENGLKESRNTLSLAQKLLKRNEASRIDSLNMGQAYYWMGRFYSIAGDLQTAFMYMRLARIFYPGNNQGVLNNWQIGMGDLHRLAGNYDSAKHYLKPFENDKTWGKPIFANLYIALKEYDKALGYINSSIETVNENGDILNKGRMYFLASKAYLAKKNYLVAAEKGRVGLELLTKTKRNPYLMEQYEVLADVFNKLGKNDSAYYFLKLHTSLKDSLLSRQFYFRLNDYKQEIEEAKKTSHIQLLQKDNLLKAHQLQQEILLKLQRETEISLLARSNDLKSQELLNKEQALSKQVLLQKQKDAELNLVDKENKLKDERLSQQSFTRNALLAGLFLILLLGLFIFRNLSLKRKNEKLALGKKQTELQQKASDMEMQALRAQMNPHFIFNCLTSINRFILKNETGPASDYLTRFSRLIRMVLVNSKKQLISLEDEIEMLKLYLDMERLRFKNSFDYRIIFNNTVDAGAISIPPLLLQPFCENAIWHGLLNKESQGELEIGFNMEDATLICTITDNGVGREMAALLKSHSAEERKSLGLKITAERLALLGFEERYSSYIIEDLYDENGSASGTRVTVSMVNPELVAAQ